MDSDGEGSEASYEAPDAPSSSAAAGGPRARVRLAFKPGAKVGVAPTDPGAQEARCHVCGERGHCAGFKGPLYVDCSSETMACYLCKLKGHSTQTCPHRIVPTAASGGGGSRSGVASALPRGWRRRATLPLAREVTGGLAAPPYECRLAAAAVAPTAYDAAHRWRVDAAVLRLHSRRLSLLSFHPHFPDRLVGADKSGELSVWNFAAKSDRSVWAGAHRWLINGLCWAGDTQPHVAVTASADGTVRLLDVASRASELLLDLNPAGWTGVESQWRMLYALSTSASGSGDGPPVIAGDDVGRFWGIDPRDRHKVLGHVQAHKRGCKVQSLHHNPGQPGLLVSAGNDWAVKLWDVRSLTWRRDASLYTIAPTPNNTDRTPLTAYDHDESAPPAGAALPASVAVGDDNDANGEEGGADGGIDDGDAAAAAPGSSSSSSSAAAAAATKPKRRAPAYSIAKEPLAEPLGVLPHQRVVTAAYFSPATGSKLLTTCIDNRLRVWDDLHALAGCGLGGGTGSGSGRKASSSSAAASARAPPPPSAEIVHSHDFARYLTPFKAVWDPKDARERTVLCGRYISEPFHFPRGTESVGDNDSDDAAAADGGGGGRGGNDPYLALHPIDVLDVGPPAFRRRRHCHRRPVHAAAAGGPAAAHHLPRGGGAPVVRRHCVRLQPVGVPVAPRTRAPGAR
jgi:DNA damage-binding protein 2